MSVNLTTYAMCGILIKEDHPEFKSRDDFQADIDEIADKWGFKAVQIDPMSSGDQVIGNVLLKHREWSNDERFTKYDGGLLIKDHYRFMSMLTDLGIGSESVDYGFFTFVEYG